MISMVPWNQIPSANISTFGYFGSGRWNTMGSSVYFTNQLQNQSQIAGVNHNRLYAYQDNRLSSSSAGYVESPATDLDVTCESFHDFEAIRIGTAQDFNSESTRTDGSSNELLLEVLTSSCSPEHHSKVCRLSN